MQKIEVVVGGEILTFSDESPIRIGRSLLSEIRIADPRVSRHHGVLSFDREWTYVDCSSGGTWLQGSALKRICVLGPVELHLGGVNSTRILVRPLLDPKTVSMNQERGRASVCP